MIGLAAYQRSTTVFLFLSHLVVALVAISTWLYIEERTSLTQPAQIGITAGASVAAALIWAVTMQRLVTAPSRLIWQGVLHAMGESQDDAPPAAEHSPFARQMVHQALHRIYDLASSAKEMDSHHAGRTNFFQSLFENMPMPVITLDRNQNITYLNTLAKLYIERGAEEAVGSEFGRLYSLAFSNQDTFSKWLAECQASKIKENQIWPRAKLTRTDGSAFYIDLAAHYSKNDSQGIETVVTFLDHTKRYSRDEEAVSFVSLAVHELRSPITILRGYIETLDDELAEQLDPELKAFMQRMSASAAQLATFVNNILNVTRIDQDHLKVHLREEDWREFLNNSYDDFSLRARVRDRELRLELPEHVPMVAADTVSIYEVLSNLIDNAIKYSRENGEIILKVQEKDGMVETTVQDFGIGIPASLMEHLFDKFYRSHRSRESVGGTGLGLYLSKAIVEAHGGTIWVKSREGEGATFGFTLPIYANVAEQLQKPDNENKVVRTAHGWIKNHSMFRR